MIKVLFFECLPDRYAQKPFDKDSQPSEQISIAQPDAKLFPRSFRSASMNSSVKSPV